MTTKTTRASDEFRRVQTLLRGLTISVPIALMELDKIEALESTSATNSVMEALCSELRRALKAVRQPEDYDAMAQAYEAYTEAVVCDEFCRRGIVLERTPGTGDYRQKRPDFIHRAPAGGIYVEVKALEIADRLTRHEGIAQDALGIAVDLDTRARTPGLHFGEPHVISGHIPGTRAAGRVDTTARRIHNVVKLDQIEYGPTILVVDLGRLAGMPCGPSGLLPVFFHDEPPAESCVSGEMWHIALGEPGDRLFELPEFDGKSNLGDKQTELGVLRQFPSLLAITFLYQGWSKPSELFTIWNRQWDQSRLANACAVDEPTIEAILRKYSDGLNDENNELGWPYRTVPLRSRVP
jgi:hypothetical protein